MIEKSEILEHKFEYPRIELEKSIGFNKITPNGMGSWEPNAFAYHFYFERHGVYPSEVNYYNPNYIVKGTLTYLEDIKQAGYLAIWLDSRVSFVDYTYDEPRRRIMRRIVSHNIQDEDLLLGGEDDSIENAQDDAALDNITVDSKNPSQSVQLRHAVFYNPEKGLVAVIGGSHVSRYDEHTLGFTVLYNPMRTTQFEAINSVMLPSATLAKKKEKRPEIFLVISGSRGITLQKAPLEESSKDLNIELNYGIEFANSIYPNMLNKFRTQSKGIFLFHGQPGTGKSTLIKRLCYDLSNEKKVIYIPSDHAGLLTDSSSLKFFMENANSVIIIEDAENIIKSRDSHSSMSNVVSNLLNVSDGILSDILKIQIVITFNTDKRQIDKAFLRPGRLNYIHEFKCLTKEESTRLMEHLKYDEKVIKTVKNSMSIAEIYNMDNEDGSEEKEINSIGFNRN